MGYPTNGYSTKMMNLLPRADITDATKPNIEKGEDIMDIGNIKMVKENLIEIKEVNNKEKKQVETKHGCIKMNDYFSF